MPVQVRAIWERIVPPEAAETILAADRSPAIVHPGIPAPSVGRRAKQALKPAVPVDTQVWVEGRVGAADAVNNLAMNKEKQMNSAKMNVSLTKLLLAAAGIVACSVFAVGLRAGPQTKSATTAAVQPQEKTFDTAQQAADTMIAAVKNDDV